MIRLRYCVHVQIPPSVSTIILSGRTQSFVGLEESVTLKIVRQNPPRSESGCPLSFETGGAIGYNCCFFVNFVPLHIESPYDFGSTGPILGVKNPLQRVNGHAGSESESLHSQIVKTVNRKRPQILLTNKFVHNLVKLK